MHQGHEDHGHQNGNEVYQNRFKEELNQQLRTKGPGDLTHAYLPGSFQGAGTGHVYKIDPGYNHQEDSNHNQRIDRPCIAIGLGLIHKIRMEVDAS